jgi:hypothetical protein
MDLVKNSRGEVFLRGESLYAFNGMPFARGDAEMEVEVVGDAPSLFEWQRDPGLYGPHYAVAELWKHGLPAFTAGGSLVFIRAWAQEHGYTITPNVHLYADRNTARSLADVQW